ncbi:MAG: hypothetical protein FWF25_06580 [Propionibacteriaceae bacterium]|nr:hypothetical protein [Propionibacteriaceae bacterium]
MPARDWSDDKTAEYRSIGGLISAQDDIDEAFPEVPDHPIDLDKVFF